MDFGWRFDVYPGLAPPNPATATSKIPYSVNSPKMTQLVTGTFFHYFKLRLYDIDKCFEGKKSWNRNYAPAQQIYSDQPLSLALRKAIQTEHSILYSNREGRDGKTEGELDRSPTAFFELLEIFQNTKTIFSPVHSAAKSVVSLFKATEKEHKTLLYTYVVMDQTMRFSQCGAGTTVDMSSKHALHAGAASEVYFAGEFWVEETPEEGKILYVDNNSGTFAPPKADLARMRFLMEYNFPGIHIRVLDYQDPVWKMKRGKE